MVSVPLQCTFLNPPAHPLLFRSPLLLNYDWSCQFTFRRRQTRFAVTSTSKNYVIHNHISDQNNQPRTLFPGGYKRPEIEVPNVVLRLEPDDVLAGAGALNRIDETVAKWAGIVVLGCGGERGGELYEAACLLKSVIRDRAYLMIAERVDIASAVNASGVVLSDQGLPVIVARNMMMASDPESVDLPLVARSVQTTAAAVSASNFEDADFLIYDGAENLHVEAALNSQFKNVKIPVFATSAFSREDFSVNKIISFPEPGINGLVVSMEDMSLLNDSVLSKLLQTSSTMTREPDELQSFEKLKVLDINNMIYGDIGAAGFTRLEKRKKQLIETEKLVLLESINAVQAIAPLMKDVSLLIDAVSQIDEPFLLAIVGEFNSGKSTVINALLGRRYLKEGVIPTTNEITFLRYAEFGSDEQQRSERHPDGRYICYLPAPILKEMNIVDTPGTNVILKRQQRLTEEFVPRADLLLFVISADRPLTESEVSFLHYIQQWKKKVVFVLNKSDLYQNASELEEGISFIKENAKKLLNSEEITLFPISARSALASKLSPPVDVGRKFDLGSSGFDELEMYLYSFLDGSTSAGMERLRLRLETPIGIADKLLSACETIVRREVYYAKQDVSAVKEIITSIREFEMKMQSEAISWRRQTLSLVDSTKIRVVKLIESTLRLSNLDLAAASVFKRSKSATIPIGSEFQSGIIGPAVTDARKLVTEYVLWLESNSCDKRALLKESFEKRWPSLVHSQNPVETHEVSKNELSLKVIEGFSAVAASKVFEQEIREAFVATFGGLGVAGLSASLLTSVLPTTSEDLLALSLCSAGGYFSLLNFSSIRQKLVNKVTKSAEALAREVDESMQKDVSEMIENLERFVKFIGKPYEDAVQHKVDKLSSNRDMLSCVEKRLGKLKIEIQNIHLS